MSCRGRWRSSTSRCSPRSPRRTPDRPATLLGKTSAAILLLASWSATAHAHDIPNAQVDRSIQATLRPGRLEVEYEVSLAELTLTQELRELVGPQEGLDRDDWLDLYGRETGPLNAMGLQLQVDGTAIDLAYRRFAVVLEGHPRYFFTLDAMIPPRGRLALRDLNFTSSEGTSRLAIRGRDGVTVEGDDLPPDVAAIPIVPVWKLTDEEERRTKRVEVTYDEEEGVRPAPAVAALTKPAATRPTGPSRELSGLLDRAAKFPTWWLALLAFTIGAAHAVQPGHGKTIVAASAIGRRDGAIRAVALALLVTIVHVGSVLLVALGLWATRSSRYAEINNALGAAAGFTIAVIGIWRVGRHLGGHGEHDGPEDGAPAADRSLLGLGVAGGLVPCWDAIVLIVLAEALGRLALGIALLGAFSLGMASVLVGVGLLATRLRRLLPFGDGSAWERRLGLIGALALTLLGIGMLG